MPAEARRRVVINTDAKNEADDQFAIVHALLSPSLDVRAPTAYRQAWRKPRGMWPSRPSRGDLAAGTMEA